MPYLLLIALLAQDVVRIPKNDPDKQAYISAASTCQQMEPKIGSDPREVIDSMTNILTNARLENRECTLRIEIQTGTYRDYAFFPYHIRGRAYLARAESDKENAETLFSRAVDDLQVSVSKGVRASEGPLKTAKSGLDRILKEKEAARTPADGVPEVDPLVLFKPKWQRLLVDNRFKSAHELILNEGKDLKEADRRKLLEDTERECRAFIDRRMTRFLANMASTHILIRLSDDDFERDFILPSPDELMTTVPALEWARKYRPVLKSVQAKREKHEELLAAAAATAALDEGPDVRSGNPWFQAMELLAFEHLRTRVKLAVDDSKHAVAAEREKNRQKVETLLSAYRTFKNGLDSKFRDRHAFLESHEKELAELPSGFPVELAELKDIDIAACFGEQLPEKLDELAGTLTTLEGREGLFTVESRQSLYTNLLIVGALKGLIEGASEEETAGRLKPLAQKLRLRGLSPNGEQEKYGPRVRRVFEKLFP
ncbi:MAG: hypothetical protein HY716_14860 [Planctomycetes bacterium]|nr:hypothetical protein [Planctomycetota bacterium]